MSIQELENLNIEMRHQAPLARYTTFQLGGTCPTLLSCQTPEQLQRAVQYCARENKPFILIGWGSNLLVSDEGIDCYVIRYQSEGPFIERDGNDLLVSAGASLDGLVNFAVDHALEGVNHLSGIPGTVGGAVVGNAGAFGRQIGDVIKSVDVLNSSGKLITLSPDDCDFSYRHSALKSNKQIIASVRLALKDGDTKLLKSERGEILALRKSKHPDLKIHPCAGSFFRNIEPTSNAAKRQAAGWFLEQAGALKMQVGGARVFDRHANIIYRTDDCLAQDVYDLSVQMAQAVREKFGLDLVREVRFVGKFNGMPEDIKDAVW